MTSRDAEQLETTVISADQLDRLNDQLATLKRQRDLLLKACLEVLGLCRLCEGWGYWPKGSKVACPDCAQLRAAIAEAEKV